CSFRNQRHSARVWSDRSGQDAHDGGAQHAHRRPREFRHSPARRQGDLRPHQRDGGPQRIQSRPLRGKASEQLSVLGLDLTNADRTFGQVEIYMERIRDLYDVSKDNLVVKEDQTRGISIAGVTEIYVEGEKEMLQLLEVPCSLTFRTCSLKLSRAVNSFLSGCDQESGCWGD
ncbi:unnamed protein product, partial [Closterium sp. Naga37s-1]